MLDKLKPYLDEILRSAKEDCSEVYFPEVVDSPQGKRQEHDGTLFDYVYIDQKTGCCGDDYYGHIYYPIEGKYLKVGFNC